MTPFDTLPLDGPTLMTTYGPLAAWAAGLAAALFFATRTRRVLRVGGWASVALLVALAGLHAQNVSIVRAQAELAWTGYVQTNVDAPIRGGAPQTTGAVASTAPDTPAITTHERLVVVNGHLLPGVRRVLEDASAAGDVGTLLALQPHNPGGVWPATMSADAYGDPLPADSLLVVFLTPRDDPQGAPQAPESADVLRVFVARTDASGTLDLMAPRLWQGHYGMFQTPRFPWPLGVAFDWEPASPEALGARLREALRTRTTP